MSDYKRRRDRDPFEEPQSKGIKVLGVMCLYCGDEFRGEMTEASLKCWYHTREEHPGEASHYFVIADGPETSKMPTRDELLRYSEANRGKTFVRLEDLPETQRLQEMIGLRRQAREAEREGR